MLIQPDRLIRKAGRRCVRLHRMRILVVEDEVDLAHTLRTGLTAEGCSVDLAHDGRQGLWMARTGEYALVVLDLMPAKGQAASKGYRGARKWRVKTYQKIARSGRTPAASGPSPS